MCKEGNYMYIENINISPKAHKKLGRLGDGFKNLLSKEKNRLLPVAFMIRLVVAPTLLSSCL